MVTYIALLRGINVSGKNIIKMEALRGLFESLSLLHVKTYIQSGNVLFRSAGIHAAELQSTIENGILSRFGLTVPVLVVPIVELEAAIAHNPFQEHDAAEENLYVVFLFSTPGPEASELVSTFQSPIDSYHLAGNRLYVLYRKKEGESLFSNNFIEKKLKVTATTRNWATVNKLAALGREMELGLEH